MSKPATRVARLDQILSLSPAPVASREAESGPEQVHLASVPLERIQGLTQELHERTEVGADAVDAVAMRLLLNDYKTAVAHLRAVTNAVNARLHAAGYEIHESRKLVRREEELAVKRGGRIEIEQ